MYSLSIANLFSRISPLSETWTVVNVVRIRLLFIRLQYLCQLLCLRPEKFLKYLILLLDSDLSKGVAKRSLRRSCVVLLGNQNDMPYGTLKQRVETQRVRVSQGIRRRSGEKGCGEIVRDIRLQHHIARVALVTLKSFHCAEAKPVWHLPNLRKWLSDKVVL